MAFVLSAAIALPFLGTALGSAGVFFMDRTNAGPLRRLLSARERLPRFRRGSLCYAIKNYSTVKTTLEASGETVPSAVRARTSSL